ncbi:MAG TPA: NAD-dependent succinate-semialdehyde dehydrogenase [Candidatus Udaeobacter sp.]|jgi:succinate-semialdehyde dehydrogenase/glutarate-semialdehyde dehydrogenase|nr:NAD-dependent succinate-semialdehyde dehydrogenase [Candidatus Udaeobacter sp.]
MTVTISRYENKEQRVNPGADKSEEAQKRALLRSVNPYNGQTLKTYPEMTPEEVDGVIAGAHERFTAWRRASIPERTTLLLRAADLCLEREEELARLMTLEMGKRIAEARKEVKLCASIFEYYAIRAHELLQPQWLPSALVDGMILNEPLGVIFGIEPWNYPGYQVIRMAASNLAAGNTVVMKHASNVPQCAEALEAIFRDAGFPAGAYTNLVISSRLANQVIDDDRVQGVSFTGSNDSGAKVAERAGRNVKKTILELGGSDPFIVLDDADMNLTVECAVSGKMTNMGQSCVAAKRFIVQEAVGAEFVDRFRAKLVELKLGDPLDEATGVAPLSTARAAEILEDQVIRSVAGGAKVVLGGKRAEPGSAFFEPTILSDVQKGTPAYDEELFGPVASVMIVPDEQTAIKVANDTKYGLGASIYTIDQARGRRVADQIDAGMVYINHPAWIYEDMPFGGIKKSGYGRECGPLGIEEFLNKKLYREM